MSDKRGFSLLQMLVTLAVVGIVSVFAVLGVQSARGAMRLQTSARSFAQTVEKARLDAIRRHGTTNVEFTSSTSYQVSMDFNGNGVVEASETRTYALESGIVLTNDSGTTMTTSPFPYADFDWRGRTSECSMLFNMKDGNNNRMAVQVAGSGDVTVNNSITTLPTVTYTTVNATSDIVSGSTITGTATRLNLSPCSTGSAAVVPPTTTTGPGGCSMTPNVGMITIRRNGGSTGNFIMSVTSAGTITAGVPSNLSSSPTTRGVTSTSGGTGTFTISSTDRTRGTFPVTFNFSTCTPATVYVKVIN
ncbi:MAG: GspH/FimT family pseudopilin [Acidobacteria bacterium]|nr:GspH/FimT family pseudopilin [Acidobacteriota bacterium]